MTPYISPIDFKEGRCCGTKSNVYIILKIQFRVHMDMPIYSLMISTQIHI
jgi:hypothetical protein